MATIVAVDEVWQRNHMVAGEGRQALPVEEARIALRGLRGSLGMLISRARPYCSSHLVTVSIRDVHGDIHVVSPSVTTGPNSISIK